MFSELYNQLVTGNFFKKRQEGLSEFHKLALKCKTKHRNHQIYNASLDHTRLLIKLLLENAIQDKTDIHIIASLSDLQQDYYTANISNFEKIMAQNKVRLIALCSETDMEQNDFYAHLQMNRNFKTKSLSEPFLSYGFMVAGTGYWESFNHKGHAKANFNNESMVGTYNILFDMAQKHAKPNLRQGVIDAAFPSNIAPISPL